MTIANIEKSIKDMPLLKSKKRIDWREMFFKYLFIFFFQAEDGIRDSPE